MLRKYKYLLLMTSFMPSILMGGNTPTKHGDPNTISLTGPSKKNTLPDQTMQLRENVKTLLDNTYKALKTQILSNEEKTNLETLKTEYSTLNGSCTSYTAETHQDMAMGVSTDIATSINIRVSRLRLRLIEESLKFGKLPFNQPQVDENLMKELAVISKPVKKLPPKDKEDTKTKVLEIINKFLENAYPSESFTKLTFEQLMEYSKKAKKNKKNKK